MMSIFIEVQGVERSVSKDRGLSFANREAMQSQISSLVTLLVTKWKVARDEGARVTLSIYQSQSISIQTL
jgi:hypothetical protein